MALIELKDIKIEYQEFIPDKENYETIIFMHGRGGSPTATLLNALFTLKEVLGILMTMIIVQDY